MLVVDQLRKDDPQLRFLAITVFSGILVLLTGLWWLQVVSGNSYQKKQVGQSVRTVRIPAVRGRILDRNGAPLADNRPSYNADLYMKELIPSFKAAYQEALARATNGLRRQLLDRERQLHHKLSGAESKAFALTTQLKAQIERQSRYEVVSNVVAQLGRVLRETNVLSEREFQSVYESSPVLPIKVFAGLDATNLARFEEQSITMTGVNLGIQSLRYYPNAALGFHLLGYLRDGVDTAAMDGAKYNYRLKDYAGKNGIEHIFDEQLRGTPGSNTVLINNLGYRQTETVIQPAEAGLDVVLTIDRDIQVAAEKALLAANAHVRGSVVVMDVNNGDILAMASAPTFDPNYFIRHPEPALWKSEYDRFIDADLKVQINRATQEHFEPGSIFKIITGLAALELGVLDPKEKLHCEKVIHYGKNGHTGGKTAPGEYDFDQALAISCNYYFITQGFKPGVVQKIVELSHRLHFGEKTGYLPHQWLEVPGQIPTVADVSSSGWHLGDTANLSIGQATVYVTPLQVAVMISAVANGGKVFIPRVVARVQPRDGSTPVEVFPEGQVRDNLGVSRRSLEIIHGGMLADVASSGGTGGRANVAGLSIAGKTGTAEVESNGHKDVRKQATWFASFAPYENPRYAVVAMVEGGGSGGGTCAPIANKIYQAIVDREKRQAPRPAILGEIK